MDSFNKLILIKGELKNSEIKSISYADKPGFMRVVFQSGRCYDFPYSNIEILDRYVEINPLTTHLSRNGCLFNNVTAAREFSSKYNKYIVVVFQNSEERVYDASEIKMDKSGLDNPKSANVFNYLKKIAYLSDLKNDHGEKLLAKRYDSIDFVSSEAALDLYLNPSKYKGKKYDTDVLIFPFGCNNSQYMAVKNAFDSQLSVIQGPPGTGKTQTILNIIANIVIRGKTVQVVSNNNSAIDNVYEKLDSSEHGLSFIAAQLGKADNKDTFLESQTGEYPDFQSWHTDISEGDLYNEINNISSELEQFFSKQEELAKYRQELSSLETEIKYFKDYCEESNVDPFINLFRKNIDSDVCLKLWQEFQNIADREASISIWKKIKCFFAYGVRNFSIFKRPLSELITVLQWSYYSVHREELNKEITQCELFLMNNDKDLMTLLTKKSMALFKSKLSAKYKNNYSRQLFTSDDLWKNPTDFLREYPVILSTTFSSTSSVSKKSHFDYLIMDEASQVDIATGALALSTADNAVIVGDTKQLPNVITKDVKEKAESVFSSFHLLDGYKYTKSFLQSVLDIIPEVPQTLLKEHYRCHPKIINFCNQKFYHGELVIMTEDRGEDDTIKAYKTVIGNHQRNHKSQRQIDVIKEEVLPMISVEKDEIGIITPYRNQVGLLQSEIPDIEANTVHKFQGREKDTIIISTVDDQISKFADDSYLINVAVSRAKKHLILVVSGNDQEDGNISDLVSYIAYNNFEIVESKIYSVFDYLYKQYTKQRKAFLKTKLSTSEYDSENLMFAVIDEVLKQDKFAKLDVVCHFPMMMLIKDTVLMNADEYRYAMNPRTHLDFLIYNRIIKKPVLAVEVDGFIYHQTDSKQAERDRKKNIILEKYGIPLIRFSTTGSGEREKLEKMLDEILGIE